MLFKILVIPSKTNRSPYTIFGRINIFSKENIFDGHKNYLYILRLQHDNHILIIYLHLQVHLLYDNLQLQAIP